MDQATISLSKFSWRKPFGDRFRFFSTEMREKGILANHPLSPIEEFGCEGQEDQQGQLRCTERTKKPESNPLMGTPSDSMAMTVDSASPLTTSSSRESFSNNIQFVLTCVGYAVGMGNIWRFSGIAYDYGGGAFLIPYLVCLFVFGFPILYLEFAIGQLMQAGPSVAFGKLMPAMQGLGWCMSLISFTVGVYYNTALAWVGIYLYNIITGQSHQWARCDNEWNTMYCESQMEDQRCASESHGALPVFFNFTCLPHRPNISLPLTVMSPAEEYFENFVLRKNSGIESTGDINWQIFAYFVCIWLIVGVSLVRGMGWIGRLSYFTAPLPYIMIFILFIRAVTLDGAYDGLEYYILKVDMDYLWSPETWRQALVQNCFSLSIGFGGLLNLASYNHRKHNCFKDAIFVLLADPLMSISGGAAAFATLGFIAKELGRPLREVVQKGTSLAFIAYPEALSRMPLSSFWSFLFFTMLFLLGISTQFGLVEVFSVCILDSYPRLRNHKAWVILCTSTFGFLCGIVLTTQSGIFWFNIYNEYTGNFSLMFVVFMEIVLVMYLYGVEKFMRDLRFMFGEPRGFIGRWFGPTGKLVEYSWRFTSPTLTLMIFLCAISEFFNKVNSYGKGVRQYIFPQWAHYIGWVIAVYPLFAIPLFLGVNAIQLIREGKSLSELFAVKDKALCSSDLSHNKRTLLEQESCGKAAV